jgi:DnaJ family protein C protein 9
MENTLYDLLGLDKNASQSEITKAYRMMAVKVHPDKNPNDLENASKNFQKLNEAYNLLSDPKKRKIYDETGETGTNDEFLEAYEYYRALYPKLRTEDIENFALSYKDSNAEVEDLVEFYMLKDGDMTEILHFIPLSTRNDLPRFFRIFEELVEAGKIPKSKKFATSKKKVKDLPDESKKVAKKEEKKKEAGGLNDLVAKIQGKKQGNPEDFLKYLEDKYSESPKKKSKKKGKK